MSEIEYDPTRTGQGISLAVILGLDAELPPETEENIRVFIRCEVMRAVEELTRRIVREEINKWEQRQVQTIRRAGGIA